MPVVIDTDSHPRLLGVMYHALSLYGVQIVGGRMAAGPLDQASVDSLEKHIDRQTIEHGERAVRQMVSLWLLSGEGNMLVMERGEAATTMNGVSPHADMALLLHSVQEGDI